MTSADRDIACHACGAAIALAEIGVRDVCERCRAYLHSCRQCDFYEPGAHNDCREPSAERVVEKERANFCDFFQLGGGATGGAASGGTARGALDALFRKS